MTAISERFYSSEEGGGERLLFFFRPTFLDGPQAIVHGVEFRIDRGCTGQFVICIPLLRHQLSAYFGCAQACIQAVCMTCRVRLALAIHDILYIWQSFRQMYFGLLASPFIITVDVAEFAFPFCQRFSQRLAILAQHIFGPTWLSIKYALHDLGHEMTSFVSAQTRLCFVQCIFDW